MSRRKHEDPLKPLRKIADALEHADQAKALLEEVWTWYGPYGPSLPQHKTADRARALISGDEDLKAVFTALQMPEALQNRLQAFFDFDDSE